MLSLKMSIEVFYSLSNFILFVLRKEIKAIYTQIEIRHIDLIGIPLVRHQTYVSLRTMVCLLFPRRPLKIISKKSEQINEK